MRMFHQHPDGLVYVRTDAGTYGDTRENFRADYGKDLPPLPSGVTERIYEPGKRHALVANSSVVDGGPMPWQQGDDVIARWSDLMAKKTAREPQLPTEEELEKRRREQDAIMTDFKQKVGAAKSEEEKLALAKEFNDRSKPNG